MSASSSNFSPKPKKSPKSKSEKSNTDKPDFKFGQSDADISDLQKKVYELCKSIPKGKVSTYGKIASKLGNPGLARAVGRALRMNPYQTIP